jgi:hypothetical protein
MRKAPHYGFVFIIPRSLYDGIPTSHTMHAYRQLLQLSEGLCHLQRTGQVGISYRLRCLPRAVQVLAHVGHLNGQFLTETPSPHHDWGHAVQLGSQTSHAVFSINANDKAFGMPPRHRCGRRIL